MFKNYKIINYIFLSVVTIFIFTVLSYFLSFTFVSQDDLAINCPSFKDLFINPHNSHYISSFFSRLFAVYLPMKLFIHPHILKSRYFCYIESLFFLSFSLLITNFFYFNKKINIFYPVYFLFSTSLILYFIEPEYFLLLYLYDGFFRMIMPIFIFLFLLYCLLKKLYSENNNSKLNLLISILIFLCCISNEMISVSVIFGLLFYFILNNKKRNISSLINYILIPMFALAVYIKAGAFIRHSDSALFGNQYIVNLIADIPKFTIDYIKYIFIKHWFLHILFILQIIILLINKNTEYEKIKSETIKLTVCFYFGVLVFFASLIGLGRNYYTQGEFWIIHNDIHIMYNIILCCFNFILYNLITNLKIIKENIFNILFLVLTIFLTNKTYNFYNTALNREIKPILVNAYKTEKTILLANLKNKTAYLNNEILYTSFRYWGYYVTPFEKDENTLYYTSSFTNFMNQFDFTKKIENTFMFTDKDTAEKEFKANGGVFTDEELKNLDFNKLLDEDFLLNKNP